MKPPKFTLEETQAEIARECDALKEILLFKNKNYGNSAIDPIRCFSKASPQEQINVRLDDKLSRLMRGELAGEDALLDFIGYLILKRVADHLEMRYKAGLTAEQNTTPHPVTKTFIMPDGTKIEGLSNDEMEQYNAAAYCRGCVTIVTAKAKGVCKTCGREWENGKLIKW